MLLGRVVGRVVSTVKDPHLLGQRLLIIQPVDSDLKPTGKQLICTDSIGAGSGELIYWCRGKESSFPYLPYEIPTDNTIVGIVDTVRRSC